MSQEIVFIINQFSVSKGSVSVGTIPGSRQFDMTGTHAMEDVGVATSVDSQVPKGAIGTIGWLYIENQSGAADNLLIGSDGSTYPIMFKPGEGSAFRWNAAAVHVKSSTANPFTYYFVMIES